MQPVLRRVMMEETKVFMQTTELEHVFRDRYGYNTERVVLDCKHKKPQTQLRHAASQFIYDHDGSHRNTLLIVYYSGHGHLEEEDGVQRLHISGYACPMSANLKC